MALISPHEIAEGHQPQRIAGCGGRAGAGLTLRPDWLIWLDVSVDIDHEGGRRVVDTHRCAEEVNQVSADSDRLLEDCPHHGLVASGCGQGAKVAVIHGAVHPSQEIIQRDPRGDCRTLTTEGDVGQIRGQCFPGCWLASFIS